MFSTPALVTFRWADENSFIQNFNSETRVSQYFYDKDGNILMDEWVMTVRFDETVFEQNESVEQIDRLMQKCVSLFLCCSECLNVSTVGTTE